MLMLALAWLRKLWRAGRRSQQTFSPREAAYLRLAQNNAAARTTVILKTPYGMTGMTTPTVVTSTANTWGVRWWESS